MFDANDSWINGNPIVHVILMWMEYGTKDMKSIMTIQFI